MVRTRILYIRYRGSIPCLPTICELSIMVIMLVSKTKDVGSIPSARANLGR